jgi:hypothetical protein
MNHNLLRVSSDFKQLGFSESNTNFIQCYNNIHANEGVVRCVMKSCDIPNVFYNIDNIGYNFTNTGNNTFTWTNASNVTALTTIPRGQYTIAQLLALINTAFYSAYTPNGSVSLILNPITQKIYISNTSGQSFGISINSPIAPYLGMLSDVPWTTTPAVLFAGFPNLAGIQEVYITSQKISDGSNMIVASNTMYPVILNVQMSVPFGAFQHYETNHPEIDDIEYTSISQGTSIRQVDIQLRDRFGNILDLGGLPFNLIMKIYHVHNS